MSRAKNKTARLIIWAKVIANQRAPKNIRKDVEGEILVLGLELARKRKSDEYIFTSMKNLAIRAIVNAQRESKLEEVAWEQSAQNVESDLHTTDLLNRVYQATETLDRRTLTFLCNLAQTVIATGKSNIAEASRRTGFSKAHGSKLLKELRSRVNGDTSNRTKGGSGLRDVRDIQDLRNLLRRRARER